MWNRSCLQGLNKCSGFPSLDAVAEARSLRIYLDDTSSIAGVRLYTISGNSSYCQARADVRVRVRRDVRRVRIHESAIRIRVVVRTIDDTASRVLYL